jgi:precorrin-6B methylase 2
MNVVSDKASTRDPAALLMGFAMGMRQTQMLRAAAALGIADHLADEALHAAAIAAGIGADADALSRLLRALASLGIFEALPDGRYANNSASRLLRANQPGSLRDMVLLYGSDWLCAAYARLEHSLRTGQPGFDAAHGMPFYPWLDRHPEAAEAFGRAMADFSAQEVGAVIAAWPAPQARHLVDVGGGTGSLVAALLRAMPGLTATLVERPEVAARAERELAEAGLAHRVRCLGGDAFSALPEGGDVYVLKSVLHNCADAQAVALLGACRRAMGADARLIIAERILPETGGASAGTLFDINMLVVTGGRERALADYAALSAEAGFAPPRLLPTHSSLSLVEAFPA